MSLQPYTKFRLVHDESPIVGLCVQRRPLSSVPLWYVLPKMYCPLAHSHWLELNIIDQYSLIIIYYLLFLMKA